MGLNRLVDEWVNKVLEDELLIDKKDLEMVKRMVLRYNYLPRLTWISQIADYEMLRIEYMRYREKERYSLKIDGKVVPFGTVEKVKRWVFLEEYIVRVEIFPCMIPKALEAIALYQQTNPVIEFDDFTEKETLEYLKKGRLIQEELNKLLESSILDRKKEIIGKKHLVQAIYAPTFKKLFS